MNSHWIKVVITLILSITSAQLYAANLSIPNTFNAGDRAVASEVNANFSAIEAAFNALAEKVQSLEDQLAATEQKLADAEDEIAALQNNSVLELDGWLRFDNSGEYPTAEFSGVNVRIVNDLGSTNEVNGTGNLIIGYNEEDSNAYEACMDGRWQDQTTCEANSSVWTANFRSGSHNLVVGRGHSYSQYGGLVVGNRNIMAAAFATAIGERNHAAGWGSTVSGGQDNTASGRYSSVSGGYSNTARGADSSVSGGHSNTASSSHSSVSGGIRNTASGPVSSVSGGYSNTASGSRSSVSGGSNKTSNAQDGWTAGDNPDN